MAILKGFPPAQLISPGIRIGPGDLEYTLLPQDFIFVNSGPRGFVFDVECRTGPMKLDPETYKACYLTTRIVVTRDSKIWPIWSPRKDHHERVVHSAKVFTKELKERGEKYEAFYTRRKELKNWEARLYVAEGTVLIKENNDD